MPTNMGGIGGMGPMQLITEPGHVTPYAPYGPYAGGDHDVGGHLGC